MKEIVAEGMKYLYFPMKEGLAPEILPNVNASALQNLWEELLSKHSNTFRFVLFRFRATLFLYFLYWLGDKNLKEVDEKVETDSYSDNDFKNAVATRFGKLRCSNCGWEGYTLVMTLADVYVAHSALEDHKLKLLTDDKIKKCPNCASRLRQLVVKIFPQ